MNYMEKLNKEEIKNNDLEILKPGWVLLKRDVITGKTITISHPKTNVVENNVENNVVNLLVKLHEKRTNCTKLKDFMRFQILCPRSLLHAQATYY